MVIKDLLTYLLTYLSLGKLGRDFCAGAENSVGPILQIILTE